MSRANKTIANIYNPLNQDRETLLENFVIRKKEFETIFRDIKKSKLGQTSQNIIIQGQRGSGKTTLLAKLKYEIENTKDLSHMLPVQFAEEQYNIFSLNRLWENVAEILEEKDGFKDIVDEMEKFGDEDDYYFVLNKYLSKNHKKLILLVDNFGDILDKIGKKDHRKLRDTLHEYDLQIIAGSTKTLETTYKHDKPFFESFKTAHLESLSKDDVRRLLENLNRQYNNNKALEVINKQKGRIETIRRLTGGIPRTIILLYEIIIDDSANVFEDLEGILDKITPLYKHKMDDLSTQQQVIIDALALNWDGMLTTEISKKTRLESKKISAQLKALERNGFVISTLVNNKNKLYKIEERFFNIWYLMRYGRKKKKQQILWLVSFLKDWCTEEELIERAKKHIDLTQTGELNQRGGYYMAEALSRSIKDPEVKYKVLSKTKDYLSRSHPEFAENLSETDSLIFTIANQAYKDKDFRKAEEFYLKAINTQNVLAMLILAWIYHNEHNDIKKAEKFYRMAAEHKNAMAMLGLALLYENEKDFKKAEKFYLMATEHENTDAMLYLALLYEDEYKDLKKAEKFYLMAVEYENADAMFNLALLYQNEYKDLKKAEKFYLMAVGHEQTKAMFSLALLYQNEYKDLKKAEEYFLMAVDHNHTESMFSLAWLFQKEYKDLMKAEKFYLMAVDRGHVGAMFQLALLYEYEYRDYKKAEDFYLMAIKDESPVALYKLAIFYEEKLKNFKKAKKYYSLAIENDFKNNMDFLIDMRTDNDIEIELSDIFNKYHDKTNHKYLLARAIFMIHTGEYKDSVEFIKGFLNSTEDIGNYQKHITNYLLLLISNKQYHLAMILFDNDYYQLKKIIKPVYYALMYLMKDEYPAEYKRMGEELKETVSEILERIKTMEKDNLSSIDE